MGTQVGCHFGGWGWWVVGLLQSHAEQMGEK